MNSKKTDSSSKDFQKVQIEFAEHLRDPVNNPAPKGIEARRLNIYRDLFFGNIKSLVSQTFPVLQKFYTRPQWDALIRSFMTQHRAHSPLFLEVSSEFVQFLQESYKPTSIDPPFMLELAHYEWVELAVSVMDEEIDTKQINPEGDLLNDIPFLSPLLASLAYQYPVHLLKPGFDINKHAKEPSFLLVYRKRDDSVEFMQLNAVSARLIELLSESTSQTGLQLMQKIAIELQHPEPQQVINGGLAILEQFKEKDVILGTRV